MKAKILLCSMLVLGSLSYAAETTPTDSVAQEVMSEVKNIEEEYQALTAEHDLFNPPLSCSALLLHESNTLSPQLFDN